MRPFERRLYVGQDVVVSHAFDEIGLRQQAGGLLESLLRQGLIEAPAARVINAAGE